MTFNILPEPILSLALDPVDRIKQNDQFAVGGLWTGASPRQFLGVSYFLIKSLVFTKVKGAVAEGHRLENLTWRLWYRARSIALKESSTTNHGRSLYHDLSSRPPLLSSPSLTPSSSSESSNSSNDWDRETAVNEDEDISLSHSCNGLGMTVVSPLSEKPNVKFARPPLSPAPSGVAERDQDARIQLDVARMLPSPALASPHHPLHIAPDAHPGPRRAHLKGGLFSSPQNQPIFSEVPSVPPRIPVTPPAFNDSLSAILPSTSSRHSSHSALAMPQVASLARIAETSSSMPDIGNSTVGSLLSFLLSDKTMISRLTVNLPNSKPTKGPSIVIQTKESNVLTEGPTSARSSYSRSSNSPSQSMHITITSTTSTPRQFPTVVVVNPTPHPTPPTTPSEDIGEQPVPHPSGIRTPRSPSDKLPSPDLTSNTSSINAQLGTPLSVKGPVGPSTPRNNHASIEVSFNFGPLSVSGCEV